MEIEEKLNAAAEILNSRIITDGVISNEFIKQGAEFVFSEGTDKTPGPHLRLVLPPVGGIQAESLAVALDDISTVELKTKGDDSMVVISDIDLDKLQAPDNQTAIKNASLQLTQARNAEIDR